MGDRRWSWGGAGGALGANGWVGRRLGAAFTIHPTMTAIPASIERVTLRHAQGHPEQDRRVTDDELVERARAGNTAASGELVERHRGAVYRAALVALGNEGDAEDIAQDALVLAFQR